MARALRRRCEVPGAVAPPAAPATVPKWLAPRHFPVAHVPGQVREVPADGNCFFTAWALARGEQNPEPSRSLRELGHQTRARFLNRALQDPEARALEHSHGLPLLNILCDPDVAGIKDLPQYLAHMSVRDGADVRPDQWPGFAEAIVMAHLWRMTVYIVEERAHEHYQLYTEPLRREGVREMARACFIYDGCHFRLLEPTHWASVAALCAVSWT